MKQILNFSISIMALITLSACITFGPTKAPVKSNIYYCANSGQNITTTLFDDGSLDLEYFNRVVGMHPEAVTPSGGTYKNKQMMWQVVGQTAVLKSVKPNGQVSGKLDQCKLSQAGSDNQSVNF